MNQRNKFEEASFKPAGYSTVSPYLIVEGAAENIEFLKSVFEAQEIRRFPGEGGRIMHAEMRLEDSVIMLADPPDDWHAVPAHVHVYVPNVDAAYRRAMDAGAISVQEPAQKEDQDRRGGVQDPAGTTWWIATRVA